MNHLQWLLIRSIPHFIQNTAVDLDPHMQCHDRVVWLANSTKSPWEAIRIPREKVQWACCCLVQTKLCKMDLCLVAVLYEKACYEGSANKRGNECG